LGDLGHHAVANNAEIDRLATEFAEPLEIGIGNADEIALGVPAKGVPHERLAGKKPPFVSRRRSPFRSKALSIRDVVLFARPEDSASSLKVTEREAVTTWRTRSAARSIACAPEGFVIALACTGSIVQYGVLQCESCTGR